MYIPHLFELVFTAQAARDRRWTLGRRGKVEIRSQKVKGGTGVQEVAQVKELISRTMTENAYSLKHQLQVEVAGSDWGQGPDLWTPTEGGKFKLGHAVGWRLLVPMQVQF